MRAICTFRDVTDSKEAERVLSMDEERLRAFISATSLVVYRMSADWSQMCVLQGGDFLADTLEPSRGWLEKYIPADDRCVVQATIQRAIQDKSVFELEHRVIRSDGTLGWTLSRAVPIFDQAGAVVEWMGAASDITERKREEAAARAMLEGQVRQRTLELRAVNALLKRELSERMRAEALLAQSHQDLERRVAERTKWLSLLHEVTRVISSAASWDDALYQVLRCMCQAEDWQIAVVHLVTGNAAHESAPPMSWIAEERFQAFRDSCIRVGSSKGGLLARRRLDETDCLWIDNPIELPAALAPCASAASQAGLRAAAALPIVVGDEVLAVLELFSDKPHPRNDQISALMRDVGEQVARILEREQSTARMSDIVWREQQSLLHTLHDSLGQTLTGLGMLSAALHRQLTALDVPGSDTAAEIARQAQIALDQVRSLTKSLFPIEVEPENLLSALRNLAATTESLHGVRVCVEGTAPKALHDGKIAMELFRIAQEAVTNAVKHARPETVCIYIESRPGWTGLRVVDDGIGIRDADPHNGNGLRIMQHRAASIGAKLSIERARPRGTIVSCTVRDSPSLPGEMPSHTPSAQGSTPCIVYTAY